MAATAKNQKTVSGTIKIDSLENVLISVFEPLKKALDENLNPMGEVADSGQASPSSRDTGLRILIDSMARQVHRQLRGTINTATGNKIDNCVERLQRSENQLSALKEKYANDMENMFADPQFYQIAGYLEINEARFNAYNELLIALCGLYRSTFNEDWKFVDLNPQSPSVAASDPRKAALAAKMRAKLSTPDNPPVN